MTEQAESKETGLTQRIDSKINLIKAIELRSKGVTLQDIGNQFGATKQAVHELLQNHVPYIDVVSEVRKTRANILTAKGIELLLSLTEDEIKKIPPGSRATTFGILFDKERLERDQSTEIVSIKAIEDKYNAKLLERQAMERKAGVEVSDNLIDDG